MRTIGQTLWRDETGLVVSSELVFVSAILAIGMIVGLSAYRDGVIEELADNARSIGQLNQSYSVQVNNSGPFTTDTSVIQIASGGPGAAVTITALFGASDGINGVATPIVNMSASFNNFFYTDTADFCETATLTRALVNGDEDQPAPALP